jgi:hypothetical protein
MDRHAGVVGIRQRPDVEIRALVDDEDDEIRSESLQRRVAVGERINPAEVGPEIRESALLGSGQRRRRADEQDGVGRAGRRQDIAGRRWRRRG